MNVGPWSCFRKSLPSSVARKRPSGSLLESPTSVSLWACLLASWLERSRSFARLDMLDGLSLIRSSILSRSSLEASNSRSQRLSMEAPDKIDPCVLIIKYWLFVRAAEEKARGVI
jgi:hypothetical protein